MLGTVVDGRLISTVSLDLRNQKPVLARPSGGRSDAVIVRSELEEMLYSINQGIQNLRNEVETADAADTAAWQASAANLLILINNLRDHNTGQITVSGSVSSLSAINGSIPGVDSTAPASSYLSWFAVTENPRENGIYTYSGGHAARAPGYENALSLPAGFKIFDNNANQQYVVGSDATAGTGGTIASVEILPWTRVEEIIANSPLHKVGPVIELLFNHGIFAINAQGELDFSVTFQQRLSAIEQQGQTNASGLTALGQRVNTVESEIVDLEHQVANNTTSINSQATQIQGLQNQTNQLGTRVTATESGILALGQRLDRDEATLTTQGQTITTQGTQLTQIGTTVAQNTEAIHSLDTARQNLENRVTADERNLQDLQAAVTDARATIAAHGQELNTLETSKLNVSDLEGRVDAMFAARNKIFTLRNDVNGVVSKAVTRVVSESVAFTSTIFRVITGFGNLNFRLLDISAANSPYAKMPVTAKALRTGVDTLEIEFWQPDNPDGTANPVADGAYTVAVQRFYLGN